MANRKTSSRPWSVLVALDRTHTARIAGTFRAAKEFGPAVVQLLEPEATLTSRYIDTVLANGTGGLSGPAVFPLAVRMVHQVSHAVSIPVIGVGGVSSAENVIEMMLAGASAVEVGAANLTVPTACRDIILDLPEVMDRLGIENIKDIIGGYK